MEFYFVGVEVKIPRVKEQSNRGDLLCSFSLKTFYFSSRGINILKMEGIGTSEIADLF